MIILITIVYTIILQSLIQIFKLLDKKDFFP